MDVAELVKTRKRKKIPEKDASQVCYCFILNSVLRDTITFLHLTFHVNHMLGNHQYI